MEMLQLGMAGGKVGLVSLPSGEVLLSRCRDLQEALVWYILKILSLSGLQI